MQNIAAQQNHRDACFALTAWYLVGSPGVLPQSDTEAFLWAKKAAEAGLVKAMYAVGYFFEVGIGTEPNLPEYVVVCCLSSSCSTKDPCRAIKWYRRASELGDKRATQRLKSSNPVERAPGGPGSVLHRDSTGSDDGSGKGPKDKDKDCVIM